MTQQRPAALTATLAFRLGTIGARATDRFAAEIAELDLKPKHAGALAVLAGGGGQSQSQLAEHMGVAPSLVVALVDHLEDLGAVARERDRADRRRQVLAVTDRGRALLEDCAEIARAIDAELTAGLDRADAAALRRALSRLAAAEGLP